MIKRLLLSSEVNKNSASKYKEVHLTMTQEGSKHIVINTNVNKCCYYFYLNSCVNRYKYTVLNDTWLDVILRDYTASDSKKRITVVTNLKFEDCIILH
jgi:hypothetical protein